MSRSKWLLAVPLLLLLAPAPIHAGEAAESHAGEAAEASLEILLGTLRGNKKALVDVNMQLTDEQAVAFWPVYDRYQQELAAIQDRLLVVIQEYTANFGNMTDEQATALITDYLAVERDRAELRQSYLPVISQALPGVKVVRFYQLENKIEAVLRYDLASTIPVIELDGSEQ